MNDACQNIGIIGAGSFGTALLQVYARNKKSVLIWARSQEIVESLNADKRNAKYFPEYLIEGNFRATANLADLNHTDAFFICVPATSLEVLPWSEINKDIPIIVTTKGFVSKPYFLPYKYFEAKGFNKILVLSGPNFASDLIKLQPLAAVLAAKNDLPSYFCEHLRTDCLRLYSSNDPIGVQMCGIYKNILAIGAGYSVGLGFGRSSLFTLLTRGAAELAKILADLKLESSAAFGLAGVGDLFLTGSATESRNFRFGYLLAQGHSAHEALSKINQVVEGFNSLAHLSDFLAGLKIETPILDAVFKIVEGRASQEIISSLLQRPLKREFGD